MTRTRHSTTSCRPVVHKVPQHRAATRRPWLLVPWLPQPPPRTTPSWPTSRPDVYTGQPGPPACLEQAEETHAVTGSCLQLPSRLAFTLPGASTQLQILCLQILLTDCVWGLLHPADTWQDIPKPVGNDPQNRGKVREGWALGS